MEGSRFKHLRTEHWAPVFKDDINSSSSDETHNCEPVVALNDSGLSPKRNSGTLMQWRDHGFTFVVNYEAETHATDVLEYTSRSPPDAPAKLPGSRFAYLWSEHYANQTYEQVNNSDSLAVGIGQNGENFAVLNRFYQDRG
jgi:hypothetical protein